MTILKIVSQLLRVSENLYGAPSRNTDVPLLSMNTLYHFILGLFHIYVYISGKTEHGGLFYLIICVYLNFFKLLNYHLYILKISVHKDG